MQMQNTAPQGGEGRTQMQTAPGVGNGKLFILNVHQQKLNERCPQGEKIKQKTKWETNTKKETHL